jgi:predicted alpha/beta superfamily hydrolase
MKPHNDFAITLIACLFCGTAFAADAPVFPPHTIGNSQLRVLPRNADGREYQLHIGLPASYAKDKDRHYPVVFVTDGYWDFEKMNAISGPLVYDKVVPEFIIVGLGYPGENLDYGKMRRWELSPVRFDGDPGTGRAENFLRTLENEIIPFVEREYRIDRANRVLAGASLGGLFTLYAMYSKPQLFSGYLAATPAVVLGNSWLLDYEETFVAEKRALVTRLFVSVGENESPAFRRGIMRYHERVSSREHDGLAYQFRVIDGERHAGMQTESYTRGLRFIFKPLAPETGPSR